MEIKWFLMSLATSESILEIFFSMCLIISNTYRFLFMVIDQNSHPAVTILILYPDFNRRQIQKPLHLRNHNRRNERLRKGNWKRNFLWNWSLGTLGKDGILLAKLRTILTCSSLLAYVLCLISIFLSSMETFADRFLAHQWIPLYPRFWQTLCSRILRREPSLENRSRFPSTLDIWMTFCLRPLYLSIRIY